MIPTSLWPKETLLYINSITLRFKSVPQNVDRMVRRILNDIDPNLTIVDLRK